MAASSHDTTAAPAELILSRLDGVRARGHGQWLARCPAHDDRSPSLSVRETADTVLIHCFAGCSPTDVLAAIGLELADLFEQRTTVKGKRPRWNPRDLLLVIKHEALVVAVAAGQIDALSDDDRERVSLAGHRICRALEVANVR